VIAPAAALARREHELARRSTELVYEGMPELAAAYGAEGRAKCEEDARFHVRFLLAAVAVSDSSVLEDYACWTRDLLARFGIPPEHVAAALRALAQAVEELVPEASAEAAEHLRAGEAALAR
jgi:MerR family transcriptional regulator, light-induced transcriptional regulator